MEPKQLVERWVSLRQSWLDTPVQAGDGVNVIGKFSDDGLCIIDDDPSVGVVLFARSFRRFRPTDLAQKPPAYLILHPDILISITILGQAFSCDRKSMLSEKYQFVRLSSTAAVVAR